MGMSGMSSLGGLPNSEIDPGAGTGFLLPESELRKSHAHNTI